VLVMAIGAAIANLEVRFGTDGLSVRTGWQHDPVATAAGARAAGTLTPVDWKAEAERLDKRVRDLEQTLTRTPANAIQNAAAAAGSDDEVLQRVRELVGQSEARQQRVLATRMAELTRDFDAQRRVDLAAIDQGMARLQNTSGAEVRQYRDLIQRMYRATSYQQK
jgi:type II secretory pathway predicted ATPase ExeA